MRRHQILLLLATAFCATGLSATEGELTPDRLQQPYRRFVLALDGAPPEGKGLRLTVGTLGDKVVQSWAETPVWPGQRLVTMHHEMTVAGGTLRGTAYVEIANPLVSGGRSQKPPFNNWWAFQIEASPSGRYQAERSHPGAEAATANGKITGTVVDWQHWLAQHPLPLTSDYPGWRGRFGNGTARETGWELLDDLTQAEVLWVSEEDQITDCYGSIMGGIGGPAVAEGKVYFSYLLPDGPHYDAENEAEHRASEKGTANQLASFGPRGGAIGERWVKRRFSIEADEIVVCVDAQTGLTVWRRVFPAAAHNPSYQGRGTWKWAKNGPFNTPYVADGRVYTVNRYGMLRCLDATTGADVWQQGLPCHAHSQAHLAQAIAEGKLVDRIKHRPAAVDFCSSPVVIDGVVLCNNDGNSAIGYDARNGKQLWGPIAVPAIGGVRASIAALPITLDGKPLALFASSLIEPRSGKLLWTVPEAYFDGALHPVVSGDTAVFGNGRKSDTNVIVSAWRLTPGGGKMLWEIKERGRSAQENTSPTIYQNHLYLGTFGSSSDHESLLIDMQSGTVVKREPNQRGDHNFGHALAGDGKLFVPSLESWWWRADPKAWQRLCEFPGGDNVTNNQSCHPPAMCGGRLYLRGALNLLCLDLRKTRDATPPPALRQP